MREIMSKFLECQTAKEFSVELSRMGVYHDRTTTCVVFKYEDHRFCCFFRPTARVMGCDGEQVLYVPTTTRKVA